MILYYGTDLIGGEFLFRHCSSKKFHVELFSICFSVLLLTACGEQPLHRTTFALDTAVTVTISPADNSAADRIFDTIRLADESFSKVCGGSSEPLTAEDAERINTVSEVTASLNEKYGGGIDLLLGRLTALWGISTDSPRVPSEDEIRAVLEKEYSLPKEGENGADADFGCAAKGYACDMILPEMKNINGYAVFSAGSSSVMAGEKKGGFTVKVRSPADSGKYLGEFNCGEGFVSTSGGYERFFEADGKKYSHIFDAETGYPVETDLTSVTVYFPIDEEYGGLKSDVLSTMIYCGGTDGLKKFADDGISLIAADDKGYVYSFGIDFDIDGESGYVLWNES